MSESLRNHRIAHLGGREYPSVGIGQVKRVVMPADARRDMALTSIARMPWLKSRGMTIVKWAHHRGVRSRAVIEPRNRKS